MSADALTRVVHAASMAARGRVAREVEEREERVVVDGVRAQAADRHLRPHERGDGRVKQIAVRGWGSHRATVLSS